MITAPITPLEERLAQAKEQTRLDDIVLQEGVNYQATVFDAIKDRSKKGNLEQVTFILSLTGESVRGKLCYCTFVIDENTPKKLQGVIGFQNLVKTFMAFGVPFVDETSLAVGLISMKNRPVYVTMKKTPDKVDPSKVYTNYSFVPAAVVGITTAQYASPPLPVQPPVTPPPPVAPPIGTIII
jgi:hypothetical protein